MALALCATLALHRDLCYNTRRLLGIGPWLPDISQLRAAIKGQERTAALEIEAKFRVPDEQTFDGLQRANELAGFTLGEALVSELRDLYLDTAQGAVRAAGYSCRLRRAGDRHLASLKALESTDDFIHRRVEHEVELPEPLPPQQWPASVARDRALELCGSEPVSELFRIEQIRHSRPLLKEERLVAEFSLDRVRICREQEVVAAFLELEAELETEGREEDLEQLAVELQEAWGLEPETRSKFERGLAVLAGGGVHPAEDEGNSGPRLSPEERAALKYLARQDKVYARRARLFLAWDEGLTRSELAALVSLSARRVRYWLSRFALERLEVFPPRALRQLQDPAAKVLSPATQGVDREASMPSATGQRLVADEATVLGPAAVDEAQSPAMAVLEWSTVPRLPKAEFELPKRPGIGPDDGMDEAGRKVLAFHYWRMLHHEPGTRTGEDIEALHDMRVATRRMRAAFRVFGDYYDARSVAPYLKGLRQTGRALGSVRDLDVFGQKIQAYRETLPLAQQGSLDDFLGILQTQREVARQQMIAYLDGERHARFVRRFGEFVQTVGAGSQQRVWQAEGPPPYRVRHVAPTAIYQRLAEVRAYHDWVVGPSPELTRLHSLRIACKRLRYTLEFFSEVLGSNTRQIIKEVVALQDHLGDLQDAVVASQILRDFLVYGTWGELVGAGTQPEAGMPVVAPGVASYLAATQIELQRLLDTFPQAWQRLTDVQFSQGVAEAVMTL
jgi:CHAD domain-containing protein